MKKTVVAFSGRAGAGKDLGADTWAYLYKKETGKKAIKFAFANILKGIAGTALGISPNEAEVIKRLPEVKIANGLSLREFYNTLGDAIKSYFGNQVWAKMTINKMEQTLKKIDTDLFIITDLRYIIEQEALRKFCIDNEMDLIVIKMINLNHTQRSDNIEHESEYQVDDIKEDYLIKASSPEEVEEKIKEIYNATTKSGTTAT